MAFLDTCGTRAIETRYTPSRLSHCIPRATINFVQSLLLHALNTVAFTESPSLLTDFNDPHGKRNCRNYVTALTDVQYGRIYGHSLEVSVAPCCPYNHCARFKR